jgi:hypothetical protein
MYFKQLKVVVDKVGPLFYQNCTAKIWQLWCGCPKHQFVAKTVGAHIVKKYHNIP